MELVPPLDDYETEESPSTPEAFVVDSDSKADWAMRRLASLRRKQAENESIANDEIARVTEWLSKVNTDLNRNAEYFEAILRPYALQERANDRKSISLPHGTIKTVQSRAKVVITDESAFLSWAKENEPTLVRVKEDIDRKALNALKVDGDVVISTQGEILPLVSIEEPTVNVSFVTE